MALASPILFLKVIDCWRGIAVLKVTQQKPTELRGPDIPHKSNAASLFLPLPPSVPLPSLRTRLTNKGKKKKKKSTDIARIVVRAVPSLLLCSPSVIALTISLSPFLLPSFLPSFLSEIPPLALHFDLARFLPSFRSCGTAISKEPRPKLPRSSFEI